MNSPYMKYIKALNSEPVILFLCCAAFLFHSSVFAQAIFNEKPKLQDFGKSLKKYEKKGDAGSQNNNAAADDDETIRIKTNLVVSNILVINQKGNAILGLKQSDFVVVEDGKPQEIAMFSFGENATIPRSIVLIIDYSRSQVPFIKDSIKAAKLLVDKIGPSDKMAIVTDDVELLVGFTKDKTLLKNELDSLYKRVQSKKAGRSEQYSALIATLNEMFDKEDIRPIVIFQTDGDELASLTAPPEDKNTASPLIMRGPGFLSKNYNFADVYSEVSKSRATIFSIIPGFSFIGLSQEQRVEKMKIMDSMYIDQSASWGFIHRKLSKEELIWRSNTFLNQQSALFNVARLSGGYTDYIEKPEDAENVYSTIFTVINNQYAIGYYPVNQEQDGKQRKISIEVKGHPEFTVVGRNNYFAPGP